MAPHKPGTSARLQVRRHRGAAAHARGLWAERLAVWLLRLKGYRIVGCRVQTRAGEVDIVARKGRTLVIVEVKARPTLEEAAAALQPRQQTRLARAAEALAAREGEVDIRFDIVQVAPRRFPRHMRDAWRP